MKADLVLEGGGVKGIALVGAISVLEERGYEFPRVAGTSAGAIVGALVAAKVPASELTDIMRGIEYRRFRDPGWLSRLLVPGKALSVLLRQGIYEGDYFTRWLGGVLGDHGVRSFADLRTPEDPQSTLEPSQRYRLVVMTSDVTQGNLRRLPWDYGRYHCEADSTAVVDAVRSSMSIPFFYRPVKLRDHTAGSMSWLVDGGMLSNFPVDTFDRKDDQQPRWPTFGIKLSARADALQQIKNRVHGTVSLARGMLSTMMDFHDHLHLDDPHVLDRTIFVDTLDVKATDFDLDADDRERLFENGRAAAIKFLDGGAEYPAWDFEAYKQRHR